MNRPKQRSKRQEKVTVMIIPSSTAKPVQFQTDKRLLRALVVGGAVSFLLVLLLAPLYGYSLYRHWKKNSTLELAESDKLMEIRKDLGEARQALATAELAVDNAKTEHEAKLRVRESDFAKLEKIHDKYKSKTQQDITDLNKTIGKIADFTGLPLESPTAETTDSLSLDEAGEGGPLTKLMDVIDPEKSLVHFAIADPRELDLHIFQLEHMLKTLNKASAHLEKEEHLLARTPLILPLQDGAAYRFSGGYGMRIHPLYKQQDFHAAQDIAVKHGTPIIATGDGEVTIAGRWSSKLGYGNLVSIHHGQGLFFETDGSRRVVTYLTRYAHCDKLLVKKGDKVKRGDVIATVGCTGATTGYHLHYEVLVDDKAVEPRRFILNTK